MIKYKIIGRMKKLLSNGNNGIVINNNNNNNNKSADVSCKQYTIATPNFFIR